MGETDEPPLRSINHSPTALGVGPPVDVARQNTPPQHAPSPARAASNTAIAEKQSSVNSNASSTYGRNAEPSYVSGEGLSTTSPPASAVELKPPMSTRMRNSTLR